MNCRFMVIMFILYTRYLAPEKKNEKTEWFTCDMNWLPLFYTYSYRT